MADSQNKTATSSIIESPQPSQSQTAQQPHQPSQPQQPQAIYAIQQPGPYAAIGAYPPYYPYTLPPADANGHPTDPNQPPPASYMMAFPPPGMIYAYPTAQGYPGMPFAPGMPLPAALVRPKRKQVKMACTNCASACKRCDEARPCERCCKYGISDTCQDGVRKERKRGIKRGPYKRKGKNNAEAGYEAIPAEQNAPEGFYPPYFYPSAGFVPIGPDGQPIQPDPTSPGQQGLHPQYYSLHPAAYPPYAFPHSPSAGGYPVMAGHLLGAPTGPAPSVEPASVNPAATTAIVPVTDGTNSVTECDEQSGGQRGKKRKGAANSGVVLGGKDDQGSKKSKKATASSDRTNGGDGGGNVVGLMNPSQEQPV